MEQYSNSATRQVLNLGSRTLDWGAGCIGTFIDELARWRKGSGPGRALLVASNGSTELFVRRHGRLDSLGNLTGDGAAIAAAARKKLGKKEREDLAIRLSGHRAVVSQVTLPAGARPMVEAIVRNKVESIAPWPSEDAVWGHRIASEPKDGQFAVAVGIAGRKALTALTDALRAAGLQVNSVDIGEGPAAEDAIAVDFGSSNRRDKARSAVKAVFAGIAFFAVTIGGYGVWQAFATQSRLAGIEARTEDLKAELRAQPADSAGSGRQAIAEQAAARKRSEPTLLDVLTALTKQVPDNAWVTSIDIRDKLLTVAGRSAAVPPIIESLESSELFSKVDFGAAIQRDPEANADMFSIVAAIGPAGGTAP